MCCRPIPWLWLSPRRRILSGRNTSWRSQAIRTRVIRFPQFRPHISTISGCSHDVFASCVEVMEPGGRIAVNVANLGRKPYRSLSADVIKILQDDLGLLLRGEIIWQKAEGATGSVAWGSYRKATNPVLRDLTERVIVASKGRFDRAQSKDRESTLSADDFMEATLDVWKISPESAPTSQPSCPVPRGASPSSDRSLHLRR